MAELPELELLYKTYRTELYRYLCALCHNADRAKTFSAIPSCAPSSARAAGTAARSRRGCSVWRATFGARTCAAATRRCRMTICSA